MVQSERIDFIGGQGYLLAARLDKPESISAPLRCLLIGFRTRGAEPVLNFRINN